MAFNKLLLISEDRLSEMKERDKVTLQPKSYVEQCEEELRKLLGSTGTNEDTKIKLYSDILRQMMFHVHGGPRVKTVADMPEEKVENETPAVHVAPPMPPTTPMDAVEMFSDAESSEQRAAPQTTVSAQALPIDPRTLKGPQKEALLRKHLQSNPEVFSVSADGELYLQGTRIKGSRLEDLIADFSNPYRHSSQAPTGATRFARFLELTNFDRDLVANKARRWRTAEENEGDEEFQVNNWPR